MNVYFEKIDYFRKLRGMSITGFCKLIDINRTTFWSWRKKSYKPTESNIRKISEVLKVSVTDISDLSEAVTKSNENLSASIDSWNILGNTGREEQKKEFSFINREILRIEEKLTQTTTIINALVKSINTIFYIKDKNLKYITANSSFLSNLKLPENFIVTGKSDSDFFTFKEAEANNEQDYKVIATGKPIVNIENYIPGSKRKKWGIISKLPIFDVENRISGVIGTFFDITERKQVEEIRKVLHILLETGPGFNVSVWKNGKTLFDFSDESMLEFYSEEMKAKRDEQLDYLKNGVRHPDDVNVMKSEMEEKNISNDTYRNPFIMTSKIYRFISHKYGTRWVKAIKSGVNIGNSLYTIGCTFFYSQEKQNESNAMALMRLLNDFSESTDTISWTAELTEKKHLYFTYLSKNFEKITGYSIKEFINVSPNLVTLRKHFQEVHNNQDKKTPFSIVSAKHHKIILKKFLNVENYPLTTKINIICPDNKKKLFSTSISVQNLSGTNIIFYGKAKKL